MPGLGGARSWTYLEILVVLGGEDLGINTSLLGDVVLHLYAVFK